MIRCKGHCGKRQGHICEPVSTPFRSNNKRRILILFLLSRHEILTKCADILLLVLQLLLLFSSQCYYCFFNVVIELSSAFELEGKPIQLEHAWQEK